MNWPFVLRSTMERESRHNAQFWRSQAEIADQTRTELYAKAQVECEARIRAEVRAAEWEAIAMELVAKGAGRPRLDTPDRPENKVAKKIREEAQGDNTLIAHWNKMAAQMKKDGKTEDEILAAIGWVDANPPTNEAA